MAQCGTWQLRAMTLAAFVTVATTLAGCNRDSLERTAVSGTVTVDGIPLADGTIVFVPTGETRGPKAGGTIQAGKYSLSQELGPLVGTLRVEIQAVSTAIVLPGYHTRHTGETIKSHTGETAGTPGKHAHSGVASGSPFPESPATKNLPELPAEFNSESKLVVTTTLEGPNEFDFDLKTTD